MILLLPDRQIRPFVRDVDLLAITPPRVRSWRCDLINSGVAASTVAKAYRLLRAILNTAAADDEVIVNPAGQPRRDLLVGALWAPEPPQRQSALCAPHSSVPTRLVEE